MSSTTIAIPIAATVAVDQAIARAVEGARVSGRAVLLTQSRVISPSIDPINWFANTPAGELATLWQQPDRDVALAGRGAVVEFTHRGRNPFPETSRQARDLFAKSVQVETPGEPSVLPIALCGFAFDPTRPGDSDWAAFPDASVIVPEVTLRIADGQSVITAAVLVEPDAGHAEIGRLLEERLAWEPLPVVPTTGASDLVELSRRDEIPTANHWKSLVSGAAASVRGGQLDKVVLARKERLTFDRDLDVAAILIRLREANPSATIFAFRRGDAVFAGASPELLLRRTGGVVETTPLAGSIRRGETLEEDERLARRLLRSVKDRTEHEVVVEAVLQALDPVCSDLAAAGEGPVVVKQRTVQHLATPVRGHTRGDITAIDLAGLLHPTPAVGGYPKEPALAVIRKLEGFNRGWYAGPVGWIDASGDGEFVIAIRSALLRGDTANVFAGCGIVGDSDPDQELAETRLKLRAVGAALGLA